MRYFYHIVIDCYSTRVACLEERIFYRRPSKNSTSTIDHEISLIGFASFAHNTVSSEFGDDFCCLDRFIANLLV